MIGACAAFVSYLINKARSAGLLDSNKNENGGVSVEPAQGR
jgi:hypothetical protein